MYTKRNMFTGKVFLHLNNIMFIYYNKGSFYLKITYPRGAEYQKFTSLKDAISYAGGKI